MKTLLIVLLIVIAVPVLLYLLAPGALFSFARSLQRGRGKLVAKSITVDGIAWPYLDGGNPAGPPVVLIHGFGAEKDNWSFYAPQLCKDYRIIAPDLPGFGEATRDPALDYSVASQAERLVHFCDALGLKKYHLGGNSMGGFIALLVALEHPDRLRSLTLFNNAGVLGAEPSDLQTKLEAAPESSPLVPRSAKELGALLTYVTFKPMPVPGQFLKLMHDANAPYADLLDAIFARLVDDMQSQPLNDRLAEVKVPTLIVWGRHDRLIHYTSAEAQHAAIPGAEMVIFEDIGHVPMVENPAQTARVHAPFLAKH